MGEEGNKEMTRPFPKRVPHLKPREWQLLYDPSESLMCVPYGG